MTGLFQKSLAPLTALGQQGDQTAFVKIPPRGLVYRNSINNFIDANQ
jgi:hypothetical protein